MNLLILIFLIFTVERNYGNDIADFENTIFICKGADPSVGDTLDIPRQFMDNNESHSFRLNGSIDDMDCPLTERFNYSINLNVSEGDTVPRFTTHAILMVRTKSHRFFRNPKDFCIQSVNESLELTLSVCNIGCGEEPNKLCINKCCSVHTLLGYNIADESLECQLPNQGHSNLNWKPPIYHDVHTNLSEGEQFEFQAKYHTYYPFHTECEEHIVLVQKDARFTGEYYDNANMGRFRLLKNGDLAICGGTGKWVIFKDQNYCIDSLQNFGSKENSSGDLTTQVIMYCGSNGGSSTDYNNDHDPESMISYLLYRIMIPFATFFLFLVIVVYSLLWDKQNVHGYTMYSYTCSLFLLYISLCTQSLLTIGTTECKLVAVALHFFFISTFCWLTAINFDIYITFRNLKVCTESKNVRRYLLYVLFSFLVPTIIIAVGYFLDNSEIVPSRENCELSVEVDEMILTPRYGQKVCGVSDAAQGWYIYAPVGFLIGCNALFFGMTVYIMHKYKQSTDAILKGKSTKEDKPLMLFGKLFIVMGMSWILEFVGWALRHHDSTNKPSIGFVFIFDAINVLQGVAIFYIFVCKKVIFVQLWQKHLWLRPLLRILCIKTGFCDTPPEKRPSFLTQTSTLRRDTGLGSRKASTVSNSSQRSRKQSTTEV